MLVQARQKRMAANQNLDQARQHHLEKISMVQDNLKALMLASKQNKLDSEAIREVALQVQNAKPQAPSFFAQEE